jgi:peptidyl-tRNA hydrolase
MAELRLYCLVRGDIDWTEILGKLCSQVGHGFLGAFINCADNELKDRYLGVNTEGLIDSGHAKITLQAKNLHALMRAQAECKSLGLSTALICDAGRTVFPEPTITCLGIGPVEYDHLPKFVQKMRLL